MAFRRLTVIRGGLFSAALTVASACAVRVPPAAVPAAPTSGIAGGTGPLARPASGDAPAPSAASLTLADAMAKAVASHPLLASRDLEVRAREADAAQAARPPNPSVSAEVEDLGRSAGSAMPSQTTVSVAQRFELGGKRGLRTAVAALERDNAAWDLLAARLAIEGRVATAFVSVLAADADLALSRADALTAQEIASTVGARVTAGVAAPPEGDRADAAAASARIAVTRAVEARRAAAIALVSTWNGAPGDEVLVVGSLDGAAAVPDLAALDAAIARSPVVARSATERARRLRSLALAEAERMPDVDVGAGYRRLHETDANALVVGATVALPWFDRRTDAIVAARLRAEAADADAAAARLSARELLFTAHAAATAAAAALEEFDQRVVPLSERAYAATLAGYEAGRFPLLDVLDARRVLSAARRDRLQAVARLHHALVALHEITGATPALRAAPNQGEGR